MLPGLFLEICREGRRGREGEEEREGGKGNEILYFQFVMGQGTRITA